MPADTPAPSALDALLREVDVDVFNDVKPRHRAATAMVNGMYAPRLAAIVRVLMEALEFYESGSRNAFRCNNEPLDPAKGTGPCCERVIDAGGIAQDALARAEAIAKGE